MMMTKPAPVAASDATKKKSSPDDAVKDLEKRLQQLETTKPAAAPPAFAMAPAAPAATTTAAAAPKNPLLARIMAAQEKAKQGTAAPPAAAAPDLLDSFDAPAESESAPPPPFDVSLLPPQQEAPPAFDASLLPPPTEQPQSAGAWDDMNMMMGMSAPAASAPVFEDLLDHEEEQQQKMPPPSYNVTPVAPPTSSAGGLDQDAIDAILGIEGLSDQEKADLIAEQERIMASIEAEQKQKRSPAGRADAFEQRSTAAAIQAIGGGSKTGTTRTVDLGDGSAVALHGQAKTREAIKDGTAVIVQCLSCDSWMQVTGNATMMFCPNCQTVSPVATADDKAAASQLQTDMELAEQLQKEEYKLAEKRQAKAAAKASSPKTAKQPEPESSWMEWLGFGTPAPAPGTKPASPPSFAQKPVKYGEMGTSLPPGASRNNTALAMAPAYTGQDDDEDTLPTSAPRIRFSPSTNGDMGDMPDDEGPRMAKSQPLFSCVADSINSAATSLYHTVSADQEGNVHGVDTSGLLAISQAGRSGGDRQNNSGASYQPM